MRGWILGAALALAPAAAWADWPQFRGPGGSGVVEGPMPAGWSAESNVKWKTPIPGAAWSCPVVVGDKVFLTTAYSENQPRPRSGFGGGQGKGGRPGGGERPKDAPQGKGGYGRGTPPDAVYQWRVLCLDRNSGKILWNQLAREGRPRISTHPSNTFASETPATDGERLYAYFGMEGLFCYDLDGKLLWKKDLGHFPMQNGWGTASSPVVDAGRLFIQCDNEEKSFLAAFDAKTGDELWRVDRQEKSGWSTPYVWRAKGRTDLVAIGSRHVRGYDPATGRQVWELAVGGGQCSASPVGDENLLYVGTNIAGGGRPGGDDAAPRPGGRLFAVKAGASGDITPKDGASSSAGVAWVAARAWPAAASPLVYRGHLYIFERNGGMVSCYDAVTGQPAYTRERISGAKAFWASPWAHDGKIFALDEDGQTHILKAGPKFELLGKNELTKELYWSTPAASGGTLLIRGVDHLYCVGP
jgi:outer membrane protein assembly factor BamB